MCGIVGLINRERPITDTQKFNMNRILEKISYRGPDGVGLWGTGNVLLGHRRLSIIDLSDAGAQPFEIHELGLVITFNGEIYNYKEIREILISHGYGFRSNSDTEVILYAYDRYGIDFLSHLRGMFAFCLFDQKKNNLILARDGVGEKPLYYYMDSQRLFFASEVKVFHAFADIDLSIDLESVKAFFALQYIPSPYTVYSQVRKLRPGFAKIINLDQWSTREVQFWSIVDSRSETSSPEEIENLLEESVKYRLVADVEVGLLLSGGIDSSLLALYAHKSGAKMRAFSVRFDEEHLDESKYSRQVANHLDFEQIIISGGQLTPETFDHVIFHGDELLGDPACIPTFLLSKEIAKYVKVVLSGEGADELFWGYETYRLEQIGQWFLWLNRIFSLMSGFQDSVSTWDVSNRFSPALVRLGKILSAKYDVGASRWTSVFADHTITRLVLADNGEKDSLYLQEIQQRFDQFQRQMGRLDASLSLDLLYWLSDDLLMKVDRMTMAHGVEARAPFLDLSLISSALSLHPNNKINGAYGKFILRKLVEKRLPGDIGQSLAWRKKHGFEVPVNAWLRNNLRECVEDRLSTERLMDSGFLNVSLVTKLKENFYASSTDTSLKRKMWMLLCYQSWYQQYKTGFGFH